MHRGVRVSLISLRILLIQVTDIIKKLFWRLFRRHVSGIDSKIIKMFTVGVSWHGNYFMTRPMPSIKAEVDTSW